MSRKNLWLVWLRRVPMNGQWIMFVGYERLNMPGVVALTTGPNEGVALEHEKNLTPREEARTVSAIVAMVDSLIKNYNPTLTPGEYVWVADLVGE